MQIFYDLKKKITSNKPVVLTIGNFDGVHLGHQAVLSQAKTLAAEEYPLAALTFENHPAEVLRKQSISLLCSPQHKIKLLEQAGVDLLISLKFTTELSQLDAESFLLHVQKTLPFEHLVLGHDATIGKNRQGDQRTILALASHLNFHVRYLQPFMLHGGVVSSSRIRQEIQQGNLTEAACLLGRPYSIYGTVMAGRGEGKRIGFPTANLAVKTLCLPPFGVYAVHVRYNDHLFNAVANLGLAPTVRKEQDPYLEVHLLDHQMDLYTKAVEVIFVSYLRPEKQFPSTQLLSEQIKQDIEKAKQILNSI